MKTFRLIAPIAALFLMATLIGCSNILNDKPTESAAQGFGIVRVSLTQGAARTAMPAVPSGLGLTYTYSFTKSGGVPVDKAPDNDQFSLAAGSYSLTVKAYAGTVADANLAAQGTTASNFTVTAGANTGTVSVTLSPIVSEGVGTLKYTLTFPTGTSVQTLTLTRLGSTETTSLPASVISAQQYTATVGAGYWLLKVSLERAVDNTKAGTVEVVHIYANLETVAAYTFADDQFHIPPASDPITSASALTAYLADLDANTADTPYTVPLALAFNTETVQNSEIAWADINTAVANSGKYVILDLSACTAAHGTTIKMIKGAPFPTGNNFNIIEDNTYIKGITLPDSVTSIGYDAFWGCSGLTSVTIPDSVTSIGYDAFYGCSGLTSVTIPDSVTSISSSAFSRCSGLTAFIVAESNTAYSAQDGILYNRDKTTIMSVPGVKSGPLTLPGSVTSIGDSAFYGCSGLTSVTIPDSVTSIGEWAFSDCSGLTSVTIPGSVTSISSSAFDDCSGLTSVTISEGVTSIGGGAFSGCSGLTSVTIPGSVTTISSSAFDDCSRLTAFIVAESNTAYSAQDGILYNRDKTTIVRVPETKSGALTLPGSVTSIGDGAFWDCFALTSVTIPDSVTSIGDYAFSFCRGLTSVTIPGSVTSIGEWAFSDCRGLTSVTILASVTSIREWAFSGCFALTSVTIPGSVTSIGEWAFLGCFALTSVTIPGSVTSIGQSAFGAAGLTSVIFGAGSNITTAWNNDSFPDSNYGYTGDNLWTAYTTGSKPGTYTLSGSTWTQQ